MLYVGRCVDNMPHERPSSLGDGRRGGGPFVLSTFVSPPRPRGPAVIDLEPRGRPATGSARRPQDSARHMLSLWVVTA